MNPDGLHFLLAFVAVLAGIGWFVDWRRRVVAERRVGSLTRVAAAKSQRLLVALDERDAARRHADDVQWVVSAMVEDERRVSAMQRHPSVRAGLSVVK